MRCEHVGAQSGLQCKQEAIEDDLDLTCLMCERPICPECDQADYEDVKCPEVTP